MPGRGESPPRECACVCALWHGAATALVASAAAEPSACLGGLGEGVGPILDERLDVRGDVDGGELGAVAPHRHAVLVDQELLEVPGDVAAAEGGPQGGLSDAEVGDVVRTRAALVIVGVGQRALQEGEDLALGGPVHVHLGEHGELGLVAVAGAHVLQDVKDLAVQLLCLMSKLVAGETKGNKLVSEHVRQFIHLHEIPDGRASEGRDVLHHDDLSGVLGEGHGLTKVAEAKQSAKRTSESSARKVFRKLSESMFRCFICRSGHM
mmetsp:Transcript_26439/g.57416  ORF Transcript_26439/g.57416 Transcript_26439/m.57416 type:complete len:265 (+) Transcript_26439:243-1037(+)